MSAPVSVDRVKALIVDRLNLPSVTPADFADDDPLFGEGLGLDSVDALELVLGVESEFEIEIDDDEIGRDAFTSAKALTDFINRRLGG